MELRNLFIEINQIKQIIESFQNDNTDLYFEELMDIIILINNDDKILLKLIKVFIQFINDIKNNTMIDSYNKIINIRNIENFSISDFLNKLLNYILENCIDVPNINKCIIKLAQIEKNVLIGSIEKIHICAIIAILKEFF